MFVPRSFAYTLVCRSEGFLLRGFELKWSLVAPSTTRSVCHCPRKEGLWDTFEADKKDKLECTKIAHRHFSVATPAEPRGEKIFYFCKFWAVKNF